MSALLLVGLAYAGAGRFIHYVPIPVVEGFTLGIAAIIALQQVPAALGVSAHADRVVLLAADAFGSWALLTRVGVPALATLVIALERRWADYRYSPSPGRSGRRLARELISRPRRRHDRGNPRWTARAPPAAGPLGLARRPAAAGDRPAALAALESLLSATRRD